MRFAIANRLAQFVRACTTTRVGWILVSIHAVWFYLGVRSMGPPSRNAAALLDNMQGADWTLFAGRTFHFTYQSWILKSLILADLPSMLVEAVGGLLTAPISFFVHIGTYEGSYVSALVFWAGGSLQWLIIGHFLQKRFWPTSH